MSDLDYNQIKHLSIAEFAKLPAVKRQLFGKQFTQRTGFILKIIVK
jgi:hypothetical protein